MPLRPCVLTPAPDAHAHSVLTTFPGPLPQPGHFLHLCLLESGRGSQVPRQTRPTLPGQAPWDLGVSYTSHEVGYLLPLLRALHSAVPSTSTLLILLLRPVTKLMSLCSKPTFFCPAL